MSTNKQSAPEIDQLSQTVASKTFNLVVSTNRRLIQQFLVISDIFTYCNLTDCRKQQEAMNNYFIYYQDTRSMNSCFCKEHTGMGIYFIFKTVKRLMTSAVSECIITANGQPLYLNIILVNHKLKLIKVTNKFLDITSGFATVTLHI